MSVLGMMSKCHWACWLYGIRFKLRSRLRKLCIYQISDLCISASLRVGEGAVFRRAIGVNVEVVKGYAPCVLDGCVCVLYQGGR